MTAVSAMNETLIPLRNDETNSVSDPKLTADRLASKPIELITKVTIVAEIGMDIRLPEFLIKFIKPITALWFDSGVTARIALLLGP